MMIKSRYLILLLMLSLFALPADIKAQTHSSTLTWGQPCPTCTVNIYRDGIHYISGLASSVLTYVDSVVTAGQNYVYFLTNTDSLGVESQPSNSVNALIPGGPPPPPSGPQTLLTTQIPAGSNFSDGSSTNYELGTKFQANVTGQITAIRFWKASKETGTHTGHIWSSSGSLLSTVTFSGESASGWQQQSLTTPLSILANTTYTVSVNTAGTYYVATDTGFSSQIISGNLSSVVGNNGTYGSPGKYPTSTYLSSDYFRDIVFVPSGGVPVVSITITPTTANLAIGQAQTFVASVSGATDSSVSWSSNAPGGLFVSATPGTFVVTATSNADSTKSASAAVIVAPAPLSINCPVAASGVSILTSGASYTMTVTQGTRTATCTAVAP